jgi:hypothetical protein
MPHAIVAHIASAGANWLSFARRGERSIKAAAGRSRFNIPGNAAPVAAAYRNRQYSHSRRPTARSWDETLARAGRTYASEVGANPRSRAGPDRTAERYCRRLRDDPVVAESAGEVALLQESGLSTVIRIVWPFRNDVRQHAIINDQFVVEAVHAK